ncbi:hypothetical protein DL93DRAFT_2089228 [Clavulina sp. PMI_390]|nr:hypothetical protein DL93DRAFT_2089228 [Clavulina sp. PMI_390]
MASGSASTREAVHRHLRNATVTVVRAHDFAKTSQTAVHVLTDLLARFCDLLIGTTSEHAHLAGRTSANVLDALAALEELGMDVQDLMDWRRVDGPTIAEYHSHEPSSGTGLSDALNVGKLSQQDGIRLEYRQIEDDEIPGSPSTDSVPSPTLIPSVPDLDRMDESSLDPSSPDSDFRAFSPTPHTTMTPNNLGSWNMLVSQHTHDHLPPWPGEEPPYGEKSSLYSYPDPYPALDDQPMQEPAAHATPHLLPQRATRTAQQKSQAAGATPLYMPPIPFESCSSSHELFTQLPDAPYRDEPFQPASTHPYLLAAMQLAQENVSSSSNPARLSISATLSAAAKSRYTMSDSLFASSETASAPPPPRQLAPGPVYPRQVNPKAPTVLLPPNPPPRSIQSVMADALDPQPPHLRTHMQALNARIVRPSVHGEVNLLAPPVVLSDPQGKPQLWGRGVKAPWNPPANAVVAKERPSDLTEAMLYNTWPTAVKKPENELSASYNDYHS